MTRPGRRSLLLLLAGILLLQVTWLITIPPFRGSDEVDHAYRAAAVAGGEWVAGDPAEDGRGWLVTVPRSVVEAAHGQCAKLAYQGRDNCSPVTSLPDGRVLVASSAGAYHPVYYWVVGSAGRPFDGAHALYAMRLASVLLCLLFLGLAAWSFGRLESRWPLAGLTLAASPVLLYSTTIVAPNGLEMCAALALWASLLALADGRSHAREGGLLAVAVSSAVVLGTLRLLGPLFILLIVVTVAALRWRGLREAAQRHVRLTAVACLLVGAAVAGLAWWTFGPWTLDPPSAQPEEGGFKPLHVLLWQMQSVAAFPYRDQLGPILVYPIVMGLVIAIMEVAVRRSPSRDTLVMFAALAVALALPVVLTLATSEGRGNIWQGRYGLPYSVGFILIAGYLSGVGSRFPARLSWKVAGPALVLYGVAVAACLLKVRADELNDNPASVADQSWHAPSPAVLVGIVGLAMLCLALSLAGRSRERA